MGEDGPKRTIGIANYYVRSIEEQDEARFLAKLGGYQRFAHLVFESVDKRLDELRQQFAPQLRAWRKAQGEIKQAGRK